MSTVKIVETGKKFGNMNTNKAFYPEGLSRDEIKEIFMKNREAAGEHFGFDGHKMFMADQNHKSGTYFEISRDYVEANPNGWTDIPEDILIITDKVPGVVIGHPVADCPVIMMSDVVQGVTAIAHCSAELIDKRMPMMIADALVDAYSSKDEDIVTYVGALAGSEWTYDRFPAWAKDQKMLEKGIYMGEDNLFHIDMKKVIAAQMRERNIANVSYSPYNTITNPDFYSNSMARINPDKAGRHFSGAFYEEEKGKSR